MSASELGSSGWPSETSAATNAAPEVAPVVAEVVVPVARTEPTEKKPPLGLAGTAEPPSDSFIPAAPASLEESGLSENDLEPLILKQLLNFGQRVGREIANHLRLPFSLVDPLLRCLKNRGLLGYCGSGAAGDYRYELSPAGREHAEELSRGCTYCGAAPVGLEEYRHAVARQSLRNHVPTMNSLRKAYTGLTLSDFAIGVIGQAITSGRGLFLYGQPGNGKSTLAERAMEAHGDAVWVPRSISMSGQIVRVYDRHCHQEIPCADGVEYDRRWVRIKRPTVVVGGELNERHLELAQNPNSGVCEAPIQVKSNCGCLVIDDFGRQQISVAELLNRWIIPLERQYDILRLPNGGNVEIPFDQLLVFATNLEPRDLCDEAFLRRIPYKVEVSDPTPAQFKELFLRRAQQEGFDCTPDVIDDLLKRHFLEPQWPLRYSYVEALLSQVRDFCRFHRQRLVIDSRRLDLAILNFFGRSADASTPAP